MTQDRLWELLSKKLAGEATQPELDELQQLLRKSPDLHYPLQTITDLWFQPTVPTEDAEAAFDRHLERMTAAGATLSDKDDWELTLEKVTETPAEETAPQPRRRWQVAGLLVLVASLLAASWYMSGTTPAPVIARKEPAEQSEISTRNGSRSKVRLPDGSQVWLNSGSKITYGKDFNTRIREVHLTGEAFFDVVKDSLHPFIIHARNVDIKVMGTAFNVRSYPEDKTVETSLIRGIVEVNVHNRPKEKFILRPSEKLVVAAADSIRIPARKGQPKSAVAPQLVLENIHYQPTDSLLVETSWVENKLSFMDESFRDVANRMERWYGVKIDFESARLENIRLTGTFERETLQQALRALSITTAFSYHIKNDQVIIDSKP